jgi:hypothetical protein
MVGLYAATKSLDRQYELTSYSQPWTPQPNAETGTAAARILPLGVLPLRLQMARMQLAVLPRDASLQPVANQLMADLGARYPALNVTLPVLGNVYIPPLTAVMRTFQSDADLESYITAASYRDVDVPKIFAAIVINSAPPSLDYTIRMNSTNVPWTVQPPVNTLQRGTSLGNFQRYYSYTPSSGWFGLSSGAAAAYIDTLDMPGFLSLQLAVDRWAINEATPVASLNQSALLDLFCAELSLLAVSLSDCSAALQSLAGTDPAAYNSLAAWIGSPESYAPQNVDFLPFPYFPFYSRPFYGLLIPLFAFFFLFTALYPVSRLIRGLVTEKETKIREGLLMMGLRNSSLVGSWVAISAAMFAVTSALVTAATATTIFEHSNKFVVWLIFFLFGLSSTTYSFLVSTLFNRAKTATVLGVVLFFAG